jgi:hypothetical protein
MALQVEAGFEAYEADFIARANQGMDEGLSNPWNWPLQTWRHFRPRESVAQDLRQAIIEGDLDAFGKHMHSFQDSYSHAGYHWLSLGHAWKREPDTFDPCLDFKDAQMEAATREWLASLHAHYMRAGAVALGD